MGSGRELPKRKRVGARAHSRFSDQGYEYVPSLTNSIAMLANVRVQLQTLNNVTFNEGEWLRFVETYLDKPSDGITDKARRLLRASRVPPRS